MAEIKQTTPGAPIGPVGPGGDHPDLDGDGVVPEVMLLSANAATVGSLGEAVRSYLARLKAGDSGSLPVVVGLIVLAIIFQTQNSHFLTAGNLTNLLVQGAEYTLLAFGIIFVLLLGEIDLSVGYVASVSGIVAAELAKGAHPHSWWIACLAALGVATAIGLFQGLVITLLGLPSFVVTLAGYLGWQGVALLILGNGGTVPISSNVINDFANGNLSVAAGWILAVAVAVVYAVSKLVSHTRRQKADLATPPLGLILIKIGFIAAVAVILATVCNTNRGRLVAVRGVPWVVLIVLGSLFVWTFVLGRVRFGRYVYAIGGNAEAARRAGINLIVIRTAVFTIAGFTAGIAGIIAASRLRSVSTSTDGGTAVLFCIAAAVIGGTSLFGGRGKAIHAITGGLVIAAINNGMGLLGLSAAAQYVVTGLVLLAAVSVDAIARRGRANAGVV